MRSRGRSRRKRPQAPGTGPAGDLAARVEALHPSAADVAAAVRDVREGLLARSPHVTEGNFTRIAASDLGLLFELYDRRVFSGALSRALGDGGRLGFRVSRRMTRAGGKTYHRPAAGPGRPSYEIAISAHLLFTNFDDPGRAVQVNGLVCRDRLDALQRIFEHELVHLVELLLTGSSSCRAEPFRALARRLFGHRHVTHGLETPRVRAMKEHGLGVGDRVAFAFRGARLEGRINRITKRATVLVEDPGGDPYTDGRRYRKYYVPLGFLERAGPRSG